ncbi:MAG: hypothetical protein ACOYU3_03420 [Bacillota bacterium]
MTKAEQIRSLCKDIMLQQRSRVAHIFDYVGLRLLTALVLYMIFRTMLQQVWGAVALALIGAAMVSVIAYMIQCVRLERFTEQTRKEFTQNLLLEKLIVMPRKELYAWCGRLAWRTGGYRIADQVEEGLIIERFSERILFTLCQRHPQSRLMPQDVLDFYHAVNKTDATSGVLLSTAPLDADCNPFLSHLDKDITLCGPERVLALARNLDLLPAETALEDELIRQLKEHRDKRRENFQRFKKEFLLPAKAKRYGLCGLIILLGGMLIGQTLYYAVFASACFALALLSLLRGKQKNA